MSELERELRAEQMRLRGEAGQAAAWHESAFTSADVVVGQPQGEFASFVAEVRALVPRQMWRRALIGTSPDGLTRVTWSLGKESDGDDGPGSRVIRRRARGTSKCKLFFVTYDADDDYALFVVLKEGPASYAGNLTSLREAIVAAIASRDVPAESQLSNEYVRTAWRFD